MGDIETAFSENTTTPYKMAIVARIAFLEEGQADVSWHVCKVFAWASYFTAVGPTVISLGDPVCGLIAASYGGFMTAVMETWKLVTMGDWDVSCPYPPNCGLDAVDINRWALGALPELGGNGFYYEGHARLTSVRTAAPPMGPHLFFLARREENKTATIDPKEEDPPRNPSRRREGRDKSCARYAHFRSQTNEPPVTRGQNDDGRGRPRERSHRH